MPLTDRDLQEQTEAELDKGNLKPVLKEACVQRALPTSGTKPVLAARLKEYADRASSRGQRAPASASSTPRGSVMPSGSVQSTPPSSSRTMPEAPSEGSSGGRIKRFTNEWYTRSRLKTIEGVSKPELLDQCVRYRISASGDETKSMLAVKLKDAVNRLNTTGEQSIKEEKIPVLRLSSSTSGAVTDNRAEGDDASTQELTSRLANQDIQDFPELIESVVGCAEAAAVSLADPALNKNGPLRQESWFQTAMERQLQNARIVFESQAKVPVGEEGNYGRLSTKKIDLVVENRLPVELKIVKKPFTDTQRGDVSFYMANMRPVPRLALLVNCHPDTYEVYHEEVS